MGAGDDGAGGASIDFAQSLAESRVLTKPAKLPLQDGWHQWKLQPRWKREAQMEIQARLRRACRRRIANCVRDPLDFLSASAP